MQQVNLSQVTIQKVDIAMVFSLVEEVVMRNNAIIQVMVAIHQRYSLS